MSKTLNSSLTSEMDDGYKKLRTALVKKDIKAIGKLIQAMGSESDKQLAQFYEYCVTKGDVDALRSLFKCYGKCDALTSFMDEYEHFDYPFYEEGKLVNHLLHDKVMKVVPDKLSWFYGYVFTTNSPYKSKLASALRKRYKGVYPQELKYQVKGEDMSNEDFETFLASV